MIWFWKLDRRVFVAGCFLVDGSTIHELRYCRSYSSNFRLSSELSRPAQGNAQSALRHVHIEAFFVHRGRLQFVRRHQEPTAAQPATRVDYDIANVAIVRIENYVINLAQLLIPRAVHGAANVVMSRLKP
jgi:hypothetical protein